MTFVRFADLWTNAQVCICFSNPITSLFAYVLLLFCLQSRDLLLRCPSTPLTWTHIPSFPRCPKTERFGTCSRPQPPSSAPLLTFLSSMNSMLCRYRQKFGTGVQAYLDGQWSEARQILTECQRVLPHDGPTKTLISTMSKSNFQAPRQWRGYRELTSK